MSKNKTCDIKKYLPTKNNFYNFLFNFILLSLTLIVGNYYINFELQGINQQKIEQQNLIEKRNDFIKEFTELGQRRIYLAENYFWNVRNKENKEILSRSWENYMGAVSEWNNKNLLNPIFIKYYFGESSQNEFYNNLGSRPSETMI